MSEIWMVNQYAITPDLPGGTRHYDFAVELTKNGYRAKIFASNVNLALRDHMRPIKDAIWQEEEVNGVKFEWINTFTYKKNDWRRALNMVNFSLNLIRAGMRQQNRPDVIIGSSPNLFAAFAAYRLARKFRARFFMEVRDLWPQALIDMGLSKLHPLVLLFRLIEKFLYRRSQAIIVLAEGSIPYLVQRGVAPQKIVYIPNGVHTEHFISHILRDEARKKYGFDRFTIVYTGAHGPANGLEALINAAKHLQNEEGIEIVLVGDGPAKFKLVEEATALGLQNLRFLNPVPKTEIPDLLAAADAAVITLHNAKAFSYAISPNKLYDYMAAEKPVLCAVPGHIAELVQRLECGFTSPPEDGETLKENVKLLVSLTDQERMAMGRRGRLAIEEHFSRHQLAARLLQVISDFK